MALPSKKFDESYSAQHELFETSQYLDTARWGFFSVLTKTDGKRAQQRSYTLNRLAEIMQLISKQTMCDVWISQAVFSLPNRQTVNLKSLGTLFVDLDIYNDKSIDQDPDRATKLVLKLCIDKGIPEPSLIMFSGRGLQVKWFHSVLPSRALPRWRAVEDVLIDSFKDLAVDSAVRDPSRVLRLVNSINQKSQCKVRLTHVNYDGDEPMLHNFNDLANTVLPFTVHEYEIRNLTYIERGIEMQREYDARGVQMQAEWQAREDCRQAKKNNPMQLQLIPGGKIVKKGQEGLQRLSPLQLAWDRFQDIMLLAELRYGLGGVPVGERNKFLMWSVNFCVLNLYGFVQNFWQEAMAIGRRLCPDLPYKELQSNLSTLYSKAIAMKNGEFIEHNGKQYTPLYTPYNTTLISVFNITIDEQRKLTTIISKEVKLERNNAKRETQRREQGSIPREEYEQNSKSAMKPWEQVGVSRATWYRKYNKSTVSEIQQQLRRS